MTFKTIVMLCGLVCCFLTAQSQTDSVYYNTDWKMGMLHRHDPTGIPKVQHQGLQIDDHPRIDVRDPDAPEVSPSYQDPSIFKTSQVNGNIVQVGQNFEGNHLFSIVPADNSIAISDSGLIVSMDNASIAYFKENGDTVVKYGLPYQAWYKDSTFNRQPFDPRIVYDRHADRFIAVMLYHSLNFSDSRILVSFSEPLVNDSISWTHYQINVDSIYTDPGQQMYWADFPSIAITNEEFLIGLAVFDHDLASGSNQFKHTMLVEIEKQPAYLGMPDLNCKEWKDVKNGEGLSDGGLVPVGEAFQSPSYGPECYLMSNYAGGSASFFWYELTGGLNDPNAMLVSHWTATSFFYNFPSFATQMGGNGGDRIRFEDCKIQTAIFQNGNLHFVFHRSDNGWGEIVYAKIKTSDNTFNASTWGGDEESLNSIYPAMAPFGRDSSEENFLIAYSRTGPTIFPELCVINFDGTWSPSETVVKQGLGIIDRITDLVAPWDSLERLGDYTGIQRRFNDPNNACWIAGSYAAGPMPNHFGVVDGIKTWIAEVGDTMLVGQPAAPVLRSFSIFPNPIDTHKEVLHIRLPVPHDRGSIAIFDYQGREVINTNYHNPTFSIIIPPLSEGIYFVKLNSNKYQYETRKLLIRR